MPTIINLPKPNITTSIMFLTYNRIDCTKRMLESLEANTHTPYHLIIIENGSSDDTPAFLKSYKSTNQQCQSIDIYFNKENTGVAFGRNQAIKIALRYNDPFFAVLDNDIECLPNWLGQCIDIIIANPNFVVGVNFEGHEYPLETHNKYTVQMKQQGNIGGATIVFARDVFNKLGYFNHIEGLKFVADDADFGMRKRLIGMSLCYLKQSGIHFGNGTYEPVEYRQWKDDQYKIAVPIFKTDCYEYANKRKSTYISFEWIPRQEDEQITWRR